MNDQQYDHYPRVLEFKIEQHQECKPEEMLGKKSSQYISSESSKSLSDHFYNPDTADTILEVSKHLVCGTYPPSYLITKNKKAV